MQRLAVLVLVSVGAVALALASPAGAPRTHACSCGDVSLEEAFAQADAAFVGTLVEIRRPEMMLSSMDESRFVFDVETVYAGTVHAEQSIVTVSDGASCGLELQPGARAIVFGKLDEYGITPDQGEYGANLCNGTRAFTSVPASFGTGTPPLDGSSGVGADDGLASTTMRHWWWAVSALVAIAVVTGALRRSTRKSAAVASPDQTAHSESPTAATNGEISS